MLSGELLVPMPRSSPRLRECVWPSRSIAEALVANGLGHGVLPLVERVKACPKAAYAAPGERPTPMKHYETMGIRGLLTDGNQRLLLVDDVLTQGSTFSGGYARVIESYTALQIVGVFAMSRTVATFERAIDAKLGRINCAQDGLTCSRYP